MNKQDEIDSDHFKSILMRLTGLSHLPEQYVLNFLQGVFKCPGCKHPVEDYYPINCWEENIPLPKPSWKIAEDHKWVKCVGGHKWEITESGKIILGFSLIWEKVKWFYI